MMLELNLHSKKVSLSRRRVLHNPEPNILITKRFVASSPLRIIPRIFIVCSVVIISVVCIMPWFRSAIVRVLRALLQTQLLVIQGIEVLFVVGRVLDVKVGVLGVLPRVLVGGVMFHRINELRRPRTCEDGQEQDRGEPVPLVLRRERACVSGPEVCKQKQDVVRSEHGLVLRRRIQFKLVLQNLDVLRAPFY
jgi:hypothetical protein